MISQRLELEWGSQDGMWRCPGCRSRLRDGRIQYPDNCPEVQRRDDDDCGPLPSVPQIITWLCDHGWTQVSGGYVGTEWHPPGDGAPVGLPHDSSDPWFLASALERIALRSRIPFGEVLDGMWAEALGVETSRSDEKGDDR